MRRLILNLFPLLLVTAMLLAPVGCKRKKHEADTTATNTEAPPPTSVLATMIQASDARASAQLIRGVYGVEQNAWRWTAGNFAVKLRPPAGAAQKGATLQFKFVIPDASMAKLKSMTLSASVGGQKLPPETYKKAGEYTYSQPVPATALTQDSVIVEFALDKFVPAGAQDARELGVIMTIVGFEAKP